MLWRSAFIILACFLNSLVQILTLKMHQHHKVKKPGLPAHSTQSGRKKRRLAFTGVSMRPRHGGNCLREDHEQAQCVVLTAETAFRLAGDLIAWCIQAGGTTGAPGGSGRWLFRVPGLCAVLDNLLATANSMLSGAKEP